MDIPVKLAVIGCGNSATNIHLPALKKLVPKFSITQVCNHTQEKARIYAAACGPDVTLCTDYRDVLVNPNIDAVIIALPIELNYPVTRTALAAGKHVLVEKPIASTRVEAIEMVSLGRKYPTLVKMVAENFRYHQVILRIKQILDSGIIGIPYSVLWNRMSDVTPGSNRYAKTSWRLNHKHVGGFLTDGGVHNVSAIRLLFGDITDGTAVVKTINPAVGKMDTMTFMFSTATGVHGVLNSYYSSKGYVNHTLIISGTTGTIENTGNKIVIKTPASASVSTEESIENDGGHTAQLEDFYSAIRNGTKPKSTFKEGCTDFVTLVDAIEHANILPKLNL
ncbi:MAG: Gfo/Idh/MocA family oxidoreductase [Elusimicrobiota bacterium]